MSIGLRDGLTHTGSHARRRGRLNGGSAYDWFFRAPEGESCEEAFGRALNGVTVAVSHGLTGRIIRGARLGLAREQTLSLAVPQEVIWHLAGHRIEALTPRAECRFGLY